MRGLLLVWVARESCRLRLDEAAVWLEASRLCLDEAVVWMEGHARGLLLEAIAHWVGGRLSVELRRLRRHGGLVLFYRVEEVDKVRVRTLVGLGLRLGLRLGRLCRLPGPVRFGEWVVGGGRGKLVVWLLGRQL